MLGIHTNAHITYTLKNTSATSTLTTTIYGLEFTWTYFFVVICDDESSHPQRIQCSVLSQNALFLVEDHVEYKLKGIILGTVLLNHSSRSLSPPGIFYDMPVSVVLALDFFGRGTFDFGDHTHTPHSQASHPKIKAPRTLIV
jgi:hypothetical protein